MISRTAVFIGLIAFGLLTATCTQMSPDEIEKGVSADPRLSQANDLCNEASAPDGLRLDGKRVVSGRENDIVEFRYRGDVDSKDVLAFYTERSRNLGWIRTDFDEGRYGGSAFVSIRYRNGIRWVSVTSVRSREVDYLVACGISKNKE